MNRAMKLIGCIFLLIAGCVNADEIKVTLLGTGTPRPSIERFGPATLIEYKNEKFLFDVGRGATIRLDQIGLSPADINHVFLTHLHSDHVSGYADFWLTSWIWQRNSPLNVYGPPGTTDFISHIKQAFANDINYRFAQTHLSLTGLETNVHDISPGVTYESEDVKVTTFTVEHGQVQPAYGYRVDAGGFSVVISGDTAFSDQLIEHAKDVDLLIHELAVIEPVLLRGNPKLRKISDYHSSLDDVEKTIELTQAKRTVLTHLLLIGVDEQKVKNLVMSQLGGRAELGHDLKVIKIKSRTQ